MHQERFLERFGVITIRDQPCALRRTAISRVGCDIGCLRCKTEVEVYSCTDGPIESRFRHHMGIYTPLFAIIDVCYSHFSHHHARTHTFASSLGEPCKLPDHPPSAAFYEGGQEDVCVWRVCGV